jgi:hypothetical protein
MAFIEWRVGALGLQDRRQPQLRRRHRRLPDRPVLVHLRKRGLQPLVDQLMMVLPQPHKQPGTLDPLDDLTFQPRARHRRLPRPWMHHSHHPQPRRDALVPLEVATYPIRIPDRLSRPVTG